MFIKSSQRKESLRSGMDVLQKQGHLGASTGLSIQTALSQSQPEFVLLSHTWSWYILKDIKQ